MHVGVDVCTQGARLQRALRASAGPRRAGTGVVDWSIPKKRRKLKDLRMIVRSAPPCSSVIVYYIP